MIQILGLFAKKPAYTIFHQYLFLLVYFFGQNCNYQKENLSLFVFFCSDIAPHVSVVHAP